MNLSELSTVASGILRERGQTVSVAESSAGGLVAATLLAMPGASAYFKGGGVVYTGDSKQLLVSMSTEEIADTRAATEAHALHLARAASRTLNSDWGIGETGAAGPTGNRYGNAPGHSCIAVGPVRASEPSPSPPARRIERPTCGLSPRPPWHCSNAA